MGLLRAERTSKSRKLGMRETVCANPKCMRLMEIDANMTFGLCALCTMALAVGLLDWKALYR